MGHFVRMIVIGFVLWRMRGNDNCHSAVQEMIVMISTLRLRAKCFLLIVSFVILVVERLEISHAAQLDTLNLSYSALVPSGAPFWIAQDLKLFEREGLKTQLLYINAAPRVMAAILAGEVQISLSGVSPLVLTYAQGSDPVAIAGAVNQINVSIFARAEIRSADDLRGKRIGITRFGGLTDFSAQYALKKWGLQPAKDVAIWQRGPSRHAAAAVDHLGRTTSLPRASRPVQVGIGVSKHRSLDHAVVIEKIAGQLSPIYARLLRGAGDFSYAERYFAQSHRALLERDGAGDSREKLRGLQSLGAGDSLFESAGHGNRDRPYPGGRQRKRDQIRRYRR